MHADKELVAERKKLYEAIGYSENAKLATYSAEVCIQLIIILFIMDCCAISVCGSLFEL